MNRLYVPLLITIFLLGIVAGLILWQPDSNNQRYSSTAAMGGDFTLTSSTGPVSLSDYRGKVVMLYFGYAWCPDICPTALSRISATLTKVSAEEAMQLQGVFVSVDPERDTPERLADYIHYFHPDMVAVTGSKSEIDEISRRFGISYVLNTAESKEAYTVDHTSLILVIDKQGGLREILPHETSVEAILTVVRGLL